MDQDDIDSLFSDYEHDPSDYDKRGVTCKRCSSTHVHWVENMTKQGIKYKLFEGNRPHLCNVMQEDEFEDLS